MWDRPDCGKIYIVKRSRRWLSNGLAGLSLLLCVAALALWVLSFFSGAGINWRKSSATLGLDAYLARGGMCAAYTSLAQSAGPQAPRGFFFHHGGSASRLDPLSRITGSAHLRFKFLGFGLYSIDGPGIYQRIVFWPCWSVVLVTAAFPAIWWVGRRRLAPGHCETCGYDLRATPDRCPECGTIPPKKAAISI
jgi:hypothetical protein